MPGLMRGVARTAVVAGTATAVSGRVQRRQAEKYADRDAAIYAQREDAYAAQQAPVQYEQAPPPPPAPAPAPPPAAEDDQVAQLQKLADMRAQGLLTDEEFAAAKARLLGL